MENKYTQIAGKLAQFLVERKVVSTFKERVDVVTGITSGKVMIEDLGDTLPFLFWFGKVMNNKDYCDIALKISKNLIREFQMSDGFFVTSKFKIYNFDKMTDLFLGLNLMYLLTNDDFYLNSSKRFSNAFSKVVSENKIVPFLYYAPLKISLNFSSGKFGLYIEELCNLYNFTKDKKYLDLAKFLAVRWVNDRYFLKNGLFPFTFKPEFLKPLANGLFKINFGFNIDSVMSSKANTNLIYGLNSLYRITKDKKILNALYSWHKGVNNFLLDKDGSLFNLYDKAARYKFLGCDHAVIDSLLEIYISTNEKLFLKEAEKIVLFWLSRQDYSGLIPQGVNNFPVCVDRKLKYGNNPDYYRLDPQVDFFVVLIKIYQLTGKKKYLKKAELLLDAICKYHIYNAAFVDVLDNNKRKLNSIIDSKFLFLIFKVLLYKSYSSGNRIYKDKLIWSLLRDR